MEKEGKIPRKLNQRAFVVGAAAGVGSLVVVPASLWAVGFTSAGVAAGSIAAAIQTPVTAAGSVFAGCQSAGVVGLAGTTKVAIAGMFGGASYIGLKQLYRRRNQVSTPKKGDVLDENTKPKSK